MASLAELSLRQVSLQQIIDLGFDAFPYTDEFYALLLNKLNEDLVPIYFDRQITFQTLQEEIIFLVGSQDIPLDYNNVSVYWFIDDGRYTAFISDIKHRYVSKNTYDSLETLVGDLLYILRSSDEDPINGEIIADDIITDDDDEYDLLSYMAEKKEAVVDTLQEALNKGNYIHLIDILEKFSIWPYNNLYNAYIIPHQSGAVVIGSFIPDQDDFDPEFDVASSPFIYLYSPETLRLLLAIVAYNNEDNYTIITKNF